MLPSGRPVLAVHARDLAGEQAAHGAVLVLDAALEPDRRPCSIAGRQSWSRSTSIESYEHRVGAAHAAARRAGLDVLGHGEQRRSGRRPAPSSARRRRPCVEQLGAADQLVDACARRAGP